MEKKMVRLLGSNLRVVLILELSLKHGRIKHKGAMRAGLNRWTWARGLVCLVWRGVKSLTYLGLQEFLSVV